MIECLVLQFGKGIYFADLVSKSAQYCYTTDENPVGLMLLSEVALGEVYKLKKATVSFTMMHICLCLNSVHAFPSPCAWFELTTSQYVRVLHVKESLLFSYGH